MECTEQSWKREGQTTGEDWCLRGRARVRSPHRPAVWLNTLHREVVSFNGLYFNYALRMKGLFSKEVRRALRAAGLRSQRNSCS